MKPYYVTFQQVFTKKVTVTINCEEKELDKKIDEVEESDELETLFQNTELKGGYTEFVDIIELD